MELQKEFYKALLEVLLQPRIDQYGNTQVGMLSQFIDKWASDNREDIASVVVKKLGKEELATKVANKIVTELSKLSSWSTNYDSESLHKLVMEKVATKLAEKQIKKMENIL